MAIQHLIKGEIDWHEKVNSNMDELEKEIGEGGGGTSMVRKPGFSISTTSIVENTDEYKDFYPYKYDIAIAGMTSTMGASVVIAPSSDLINTFVRANTMTNSLRLYFVEKPIATIVVDHVDYWEVK